MYSDSVGVLSCVTIIAQTSPHRYLFSYLFNLIANNSLFKLWSTVKQLPFE